MSDDINVSIIKNLFGQENTFTIPRLLVLLTGSHTCALLLNQIIFWSSKKDDGWFYKSYDNWNEELLLTKKQVMSYAEKLEKMGVIERKLKKVKGAPTCWYLAKTHVVIGLLQKGTMESDKRERWKVTKGNEPYTEDYLTEDYLHKDTNTLVDSPNTTKASKPSHYKKDLRFMRFYNAYPRHDKPVDAWKAFKSLKPSDELLEAIIADVSERKEKHTQWQDKKYIPLPAGYLRSAGYEGEIYNEEEERSAKKTKTEDETAARLKSQEEASRNRAAQQQQDRENKHNDGLLNKAIVRGVAEGQTRMPESLRNLANKLRR